MDAATAKSGPSRTRALGKTGLQVSALGVGTNKWSKGSNDEAVFETFKTFQDGGISFFDTAEVYGFGKSERLIGDCLRRDGRPATIATKFMPFIARSSPRHLLKALDASLARLGVSTVDLYYIHFPYPFADFDALADAMIEAVKAGKVRHVGVSNFSAEKMRRIADRLGEVAVEHGVSVGPGNGGMLVHGEGRDRIRKAGVTQVGILGAAAVAGPPGGVNGELGQVGQPVEALVRPGRLAA